ncbi:MAG: hypothetical protein HXS46_00690 [Theionarchaea archaeon]|nr:hypothetical protein [Theionarchaea archaeon]
MKLQPKKMKGFIMFWCAVVCVMGFLYIQIYTGTYFWPFMGGVLAGVLMMIHSFYIMSGTKLTFSLDFWKTKIGAGHPLWFGAILRFYLDMVMIYILCIYLIIFVAPNVVQKLFILLIGNTAACLLLYFRFKNRRKLE